MRVWLHEVTGNETGWRAWCLDVHGFATWASRERDVVARVPSKLAEHQGWLARHALPAVAAGGDVEIVERVRGNEILFSADRATCQPKDIDLTLRLLSASREDLVHLVESLPERALDWDPPYRAFAEWATWRSIRAILVHIANCETQYYLPVLGYEPRLAPASASEDWRCFLKAHRQEAFGFLSKLRESPDRARVTTKSGESWSVRKVLRRLVWHELLHWKSIRRIGGDFRRCT